MDRNTYLRMEWFARKHLRGDGKCRVLDVGSYDVNGTHRPIFADARFEYVGLDMEAGPNVDLVPANPYVWSEVPDASFDVVISGQTFEHAEFFWVTMGEMTRVLRNGGLVCVTAPRGIGLHRYPLDCYRFDSDGLVALARYCNLTPIHASTNMAPSLADTEWFSEKSAQSMLIARKPENWSGMLDIGSYVFEVPPREALTAGFVELEKKFRPEPFSKIFKQFKRNILYRFGITKKHWVRE